LVCRVVISSSTCNCDWTGFDNLPECQKNCVVKTGVKNYRPTHQTLHVLGHLSFLPVLDYWCPAFYFMKITLVVWLRTLKLPLLVGHSAGFSIIKTRPAGNENAILKESCQYKKQRKLLQNLGFWQRWSRTRGWFGLDSSPLLSPHGPRLSFLQMYGSATTRSY
jgi:hypothetical protein